MVHDAINHCISHEDLKIERFRVLDNNLSRLLLVGETSTNILKSLVPSGVDSVGGDFFVRASANPQSLNNVWQCGKMLSLDVIVERIHSSSGSQRQSIKTLHWPEDGVKSILWNLESINVACANTVECSRPNVPWKNVQRLLENSLRGDTIDLPNLNENIVTKCNAIPILLIRNKKIFKTQSIYEKCLNGWTIILENRHVNALMLAITARGSIAIGVEELDYLKLVNGVTSFPRDYIDSFAGFSFWKGLQFEHDALVRRYPKGKHPADRFTPVVSMMNIGRNDGTNKEMTVVRAYAYMEAFSLPTSSIVLNKSTVDYIHRQLEIAKMNRHVFSTDNPTIKSSIPMLPHSTFVHVQLLQLDRGLILSGCTIFGALHEDLFQFARHHILHKRFLQSHRKYVDRKLLEEEALPKCWRGINISSSGVLNRPLLGVVTSGQHKHCNRGDFGAIGLCDVERIHLSARMNFEFLGHPLSHKVVLFQNPGSSFLRPAYLEFL